MRPKTSGSISVRKMSIGDMLGGFLRDHERPRPRKPRFAYMVGHWILDGGEIRDSCEDYPFTTIREVLKAAGNHGPDCADDGMKAEDEIQVWRYEPEWDGSRWTTGEGIDSGEICRGRVFWRGQ